MSSLQAPAARASEVAKGAAFLFSRLQIRGVTLPNRIVVSPMCQYSAEDGFANDWHFVHLGSRVIGGAGTVIVEATAVEDRGRISPRDLGIWKDEHVEPLARIAGFAKEYGSIPAIQIAHAGRKASTEAPWLGGKPIPLSAGGWQSVAPSPIPFDTGYLPPAELTVEEIKGIVDAFAAAAERSLAAGFEVLELHGAHGYLINEFLSPLTNKRTDQYGGSFRNRIRFAREVATAVRRVWPERLPLFLRISATDWTEGGWTGDDSVQLVRELAPLGIDLIDCSSGGAVPNVKIPVSPGYQVPFAEQIRRETGILTGAVGLITDPKQAESILRDGAADVVVLAREFLREPYWPIKAAEILGAEASIPVQYQRAFLKPSSK
jgi:2,4-dienoyl-CoA reductase-like NADH-dependent reductase (Old Yellow Enzyme family)